MTRSRIPVNSRSNRELFGWCLAAGLAAVIGTSAAASGAVICVPNAAVDVSCTTSAATITLAISAANSLGGDTVLVGPGLYNENVTIDRPLTLKASVPASESNAGNSAAQAIIDGSGAQTTVQVLPGVDGVTIDGFEITNPTYAFTGDAGYGILVNSLSSSAATVTVTIRNNVVHDVSDPSRTATGGQGEFGILAQNVGGGSLISGNVVYGIRDSEPPTTSGESPGSGRAQGIAAKKTNSTASGVSIDGNTVHDVQDVAIRVDNAFPNVDVTNNVIHDIGSTGTGFLSGIGIDHIGTGSVANNRIRNVVGGFGLGIQATGTTTVTANSVTNVQGGNGITFPGAGILVNTPGVGVNNNFLSGNAIGLVAASGATSLSANSNCIAGNTTGFVNGASATLDATNNWWGASNGPGPVGPGSGDTVANTSGGTTTFSPFATAPNCAFLCADQRFVDDAGSDTANDCVDSSAPCQHIQRGIDLACVGNTVNVGPGTYQENVIVTKGVELSGAGQGSSIVEPAVSNANPCTGSSLCGGTASNIVLVQASNVKIHDFTLDGDNPSLTSGIVRNGADLDARNGVITNYAAGDFQNLEVYHLTVRNIYLRGIYGAYNSSGTFNFHDNVVDNVTGDYYSIAIFSFLGGGTVANNTVSNANDAISANWSHGIQFLDNVVTNSASGVHTDNSAGSGGTGDLIQGNQVSNCAPDGFGIWVFVPYVAVQVTGNTVTNCAVGLAAAGPGPATTFSNNTVDGSGAAGSVGAYVTTSEFGYGVGNVNASFSGNLLTNNDQGFFVQDKVCSTNSTTGCQVDSDCPAYPSETCLTGSTATVSATCNRISGNTDGILTEALGSPSAVVFNSNSIDGNTTGADASAVPVGSINAQANWWGCVAGPGNPGCDTVTAGVDYSSFTTSVPACVSCNADSDCSDGLTCNGNETCNLGTHMCQAGTPPNCSALTNECATGICVEPTGCVADPSPNGTVCVNGGGICQSGVCTSTYSLTLNYARLRRDSSTRSNNGVVSVTGLVNDNDTGGGLEGDLTQGRVSVEIDSGSFHVTVPLSGCAANSYGSVRCKDPANKIRALFRAWRVKGPLLYRMSVRQGGLSDTVTGITQPTGPVTVTLHQSSVDRPDVIGDVDACTAAGQYALLCRER